MRRPSFTLIFSGIFIAYIIHSMWVLGQLFLAPKCTGSPCYKSYLESNPKLQLVLFSSVQNNPVASEVTRVKTIKNFNYYENYQGELELEIPARTRRNGTMYLHVILASDDNKDVDWKQLQRDGPTVIQRIKMTEFIVPRAATFNLLGDKSNNKSTKQPPSEKPVAHIKSKIYVSILTDFITFSQEDLPPELSRFIRANKNHEFLPVLQSDDLRTRLIDLQEIDKNMTKFNVQFSYSPIGTGKLRLFLHVEHALLSLNKLGFSAKDVDEVKGIFSDTNVYLLMGTIFVGSIHLLFDFLSFKHDVSFWKRKQNYAGLSMRTTLWRGFSQIVIFLYLLDENTSMLVLVPAGIGTLIELWKCKKILKIELTMSGFRIKKPNENSAISKAEENTRIIDREAMKYLSYLLYPLCIAGATYSLVYQPHRSWYSWTINSLVNGIYMFGFLFMLPQLFINYKLKSVAALPWRSFMYKAFNTFIDDIFAFIITMPTAHRLACFRDDIVFIIYLYQRYLYPVDKTRIDDGAGFTEEPTIEKIPMLEESSEVLDKKKN